MNAGPEINGCYVHVAIEALDVSVAKLRNPRLATRAVAVANRNLVSCCPIATRLGLYPGLSTEAALLRCPELEVFEEERALSRSFADRAFAHCREFALAAEIHESHAVCDLSETHDLYDFAVYAREPGSIGIALGLRQRIMEDVGLTVTLGIARSRVRAYMAAQTCKPGGLRVVTPEEEDELFGLLPVRMIPGASTRVVAALDAVGARTVRELRALPKDMLDARFGKFGELLQRRSRGEDTSLSFGDSIPRQLFYCSAPTQRTANPREIDTLIVDACSKLASSLSALGLRARQLRLELFHSRGGTTVGRTTPLPPTRNPFELSEALVALRRDSLSRQASVEQVDVVVEGTSLDRDLTMRKTRLDRRSDRVAVACPAS